MFNRNHKYTTEGLIRKFKELNLPKKNYACIGSIGLYIHGLVSKIQDIDVVARNSAWDKALKLGTLGYDHYYHKKDRISLFNGQIEVFQKWPNEDVNRLIDEAEEIDGIKVVKLEHILKYMNKLNRPKDRQHLRQVVSFIKSFIGKVTRKTHF